jgi:glycine oxidase
MRARVAIIGAGVMGCASALELAKRGADVVLLERSLPGAEASSAAAGILGAQIEMHEKGKMLEVFARARAEYGAWAEELRRDTGVDIGHRVTGALCVARSQDEVTRVRSAVDWQRKEGLRAEVLDARGCRELEPELAEDVLAAAWYPDEAEVDPPALLRALVAAVGRARVSVRTGATVTGLLVESGRCVGLRLDAEELRADAVVVAAGSWSSLVPGLPPDVPSVKPARGQIVLLEERPPRLRRIVLAAAAYAVPRGDGRVLCGSTVEFVGFRREVTAGGVNGILSGVLGVLPGLGNAQLASTWCNFRPYTDGEHPIVGASRLPGLFLATGHFRNGILLAKVTADEVAAAVLG